MKNNSFGLTEVLFLLLYTCNEVPNLLLEEEEDVGVLDPTPHPHTRTFFLMFCC